MFRPAHVIQSDLINIGAKAYAAGPADFLGLKVSVPRSVISQRSSPEKCSRLIGSLRANRFPRAPDAASIR